LGLGIRVQILKMKEKPTKKSSAGKGDKRRPCNYKTYMENFDEIDWKINSKTQAENEKVS